MAALVPVKVADCRYWNQEKQPDGKCEGMSSQQASATSIFAFRILLRLLIFVQGR
jgi:hypothetical protein